MGIKKLSQRGTRTAPMHMQGEAQPKSKTVKPRKRDNIHFCVTIIATVLASISISISVYLIISGSDRDKVITQTKSDAVVPKIEHNHEVMKNLLSMYQQLEDTSFETAKIVETQETSIRSLQTEMQDRSRDIISIQKELESQKEDIEVMKTTTSSDITSIQIELKGQGNEIEDMKTKYENLTAEVTYRDCEDILAADKYAKSGVYRILDPTLKFKSSGITVYCDLTTQDGGWIVFQRRQDGSENFYRGWEDYKRGFGKLTSEFWLGLDYIHALVSNGKWEMLINMRDDGKGEKYAMYKTFSVGSESKAYVLTAGEYSGDAGDSLTGSSYNLNGMKFTTKDRDNDKWGGNCAVAYTGAWWYSNCHLSNLNGMYGSTGAKGVLWHTFDIADPLEFAEMKMKRKA